jgi:hypothetical protein
MNKHTVMALAIMAIFACSCSRENYVDARQVAIYSTYIQAVDSVTKQPVNVSVQFPRTQLQQFLRSGGGEKATPVSIEMNSTGLCRIVWIDLVDHVATVVLTAEGYAPYSIPKELIDECASSQAQSGFAEPTTVELKKSEQSNAG